MGGEKRISSKDKLLEYENKMLILTVEDSTFTKKMGALVNIIDNLNERLEEAGAVISELRNRIKMLETQMETTNEMVRREGMVILQD